MWQRLQLLGMLLLCGCLGPGDSLGRPGPAAVLVAEGRAMAAVVLPAEPHADETLAAQEIVEHIEKMSGVRLAVSERLEEGLLPIRIGLAVAPEAEQAIRKESQDPASFLLQVKPHGVALAGLSPEGTLFAAYEMLEQLGCRWFMPGEVGRAIPRRSTVQLNVQQTVQAPSFSHRHLQAVPRVPWYRRMRLGGLSFPGGHGFPIRADIEKEPELFALVGGKRVRRQWCVSHPEVLRRVVEAVKARFRKNPDLPWVGLGPNDGGGFCQCEKCQALDAGDWDPFYNEVSVTDRYVGFFNKVLKEVHKEFPGKKVGFYAYHTYMRPPRRVKPNPCIVPAFAPISLCRVHGMNNPVCPDRSYYRRIMAEWGKLVPEVFERGYFFNLACPGFPFSKVHCVRDEIPFAKKAGIKGWRVECICNWGIYTPTLYVAAKLFWDADQDVDALLDDFYEKFFGPAAAPMKRYLERMDHALRDSDHHTGCSFNMPRFYPAELRREGLRDLEEAASKAGDTTFGTRVAIYRLMFDGLEAFIGMLDARNGFDFVRAKAALDRIRAIQEKAFAHDPPLLYKRQAASYLQRFWSPCTEQGFERTTGRNEFVAGLPDRWDFHLDTLGVGEDLEWYRPDLTGGNWQTILTRSASWSDQGLHYYKGLAWYRAKVQIPQRFAGRKILLWFGGVDEWAKVWLNGSLLTMKVGDEVRDEGPGRAFVPFELDATDAALMGEANVVVVRIANHVVSEIGTGGITAPVMFWSPRPE